MDQRSITHCYRDPLSEIWIAAAHKIGLQVVRTDEAFAHSDGKGGLHIATQAHLDPDDCLAQMIFHELCHSLVEGSKSFAIEDWGLDNTSQAHHFREHATLRVQAVLAGRLGLRKVLAPTTDFRSFYDALPEDPLTADTDSSSTLAKLALRRSATNPWWPHLGRALQATAEIIGITSRWAAPSPRPAIYRLTEKPLTPHANGLPGRCNRSAQTCAQCAWFNEYGDSAAARETETASYREKIGGTCQQSGTTVHTSDPACERFEPEFDCQDCGACCRAAYHSVTITKGDIVEKRHPELMVRNKNYTEIRREEDHCAALHSEDGRHHCTIYSDRPTCCREFESAGANCLIARRRLGLSL